MSPLARLDVSRRGQAVVATVAGDVDLSNAADLRTALENAAPPDAVGLVADLAQVGYLDSSGVSILVAVARELSIRRQRLAIVAPPGGAVRRVLDLVQIDRLAELHDTVDGATAGLAEAD